MRSPIDVKKLVWGSPTERPLLRAKTGPRELTDDEFGWLVQQGLYPHTPRPGRVKKEKPVKAPKVQKTEAEIARQYAEMMISKHRTRGMITDKFADLKATDKANKDLWMDTDFFFSVVFQSREQKYQFIEFLCAEFDIEFEFYGEKTIQIINGLILAKAMKCELKKEVAADFPTGNIDLKDFVLDEESRNNG